MTTKTTAVKAAGSATVHAGFDHQGRMHVECGQSGTRVAQGRTTFAPVDQDVTCIRCIRCLAYTAAVEAAPVEAPAVETAPVAVGDTVTYRPSDGAETTGTVTEVAGDFVTVMPVRGWLASRVHVSHVALVEAAPAVEAPSVGPYDLDRGTAILVVTDPKLAPATTADGAVRTVVKSVVGTTGMRLVVTTDLGSFTVGRSDLILLAASDVEAAPVAPTAVEAAPVEAPAVETDEAAPQFTLTQSGLAKVAAHTGETPDQVAAVAKAQGWAVEAAPLAADDLTALTGATAEAVAAVLFEALDRAASADDELVLTTAYLAALDVVRDRLNDRRTAAVRAAQSQGATLTELGALVNLSASRVARIASGTSTYTPKGK